MTEEERIQYALLKENSDSCSLLCELGDLYRQTGRMLEAKDSYIRAGVHVQNESDKKLCQEKIEQISEAMKACSYKDEDYAKSLNKVVSIYCYGRSGTHFFKSLLDGHPKIILTMLNGTKILRLWDTLSMQQGQNVFQEDLEGVTAQIFETFQDLFNEGKEYFEAQLNGMCSMGEERNEVFTIDKERFRYKFANIIKFSGIVDKKFFYQAVQLAAAYGIGYEYDFTTGIPVIVEGGIHFSKSDKATEELLEVFPYTRLLHMVRKPVIAFASSLKFLIKSNQATADNLTANVMAMFADIPMKEEWADRTRIIKLEELHLKSKEILQAFCNFMDIKWSETLLQSTFGGIKWWNTSTSVTLSGFNTKTISNTYDELLSSFDRFRLELLLQSKYEAWNYETFEIGCYEEVNALYKEPFKFEQFFIHNVTDSNMIKKIMNKLFYKQLRYIMNTPKEEQADYKGRMI